jgi:hypothetical protein
VRVAAAAGRPDDEPTHWTGPGAGQQQIASMVGLPRNPQRESQHVGQEVREARRAGQTHEHGISPGLIDPGHTGGCPAALPVDQSLTNAPTGMQGFSTSGAKPPDHEEDYAQRSAEGSRQGDASALT